MRLFHVSEKENIEIFEPRLPARKDLEPNVGLVWAIDEERLPNFLTPRNCPRVTYHVGAKAEQADIDMYISSATQKHVVIIENAWFEKMLNTALYVYEFDPKDFVLQDDIAGYYVATTTQKPIAKHCYHNLISELISRKVEIRFVDNLWDIADNIKSSTLNWSLCRMKYAQPRKIKN